MFRFVTALLFIAAVAVPAFAGDRDLSPSLPLFESAPAAPAPVAAAPEKAPEYWSYSFS